MCRRSYSWAPKPSVPAQYEIGPDGNVQIVEKKNRSKYGNKRVQYNGMWFDSKAELKRWIELEMMQRGGTIRNLERQVRYPLEVNRELITTYVADFTYVSMMYGEAFICEDVKGGNATQTPEFKIKAKLMHAIHKIDIKLTGKGVK